MLELAKNSLSLEGEGRVRVFDLPANSRPPHPLAPILAPLGTGGVGA